MNDNTPNDGIIGKTLGQFEIIEEVGRGGMASVYRAKQLSMNRMVAVKILPRHFLHDPGFYERFEREVDVISHLEHPHILPIYDFGLADDLPYIAMRFLGGGSMEQWLRRGVPKSEELIKPLQQIGQALDYAHKQGIIHRDLKPGNIMLDEHGNAYLSDFGIARVLGSQLTGSLIVGTPAYMSPEQANGIPIDGRSDIYALGVVLFELLTGREPYQAETPMAVLLKHINEPMPPLTMYRNDLPYEVEEVVNKATAKDPDDRYSSAGEMIKAFENAFRATEILSTKPPTPPSARATSQKSTQAPTASIPSPIQATTPASMPHSEAHAPSGISAKVIFGLIGLLLALALGAVVLLSSGNSANSIVTMPTPFPNASRIEQPQYAISIPNAWIPFSQFNDVSADYQDHNLLMHTWESGKDALVRLGIVETDVSNPQAFAQAVSQYNARHFDGLTLIDQTDTPNGGKRQSYKLDGNERDLPPGQLDVFFTAQSPYLGVLEVYTADSTGNRFVSTLQSILDSLRLKRTS